MSDWETAKRDGKRAFYEGATDTIWACPENYCLAIRLSQGWRAGFAHAGCDGAIRDWIPAIESAISANPDARAQELADAIGAVIPGYRARF